jgi:hypothetical protein
MSRGDISSIWDTCKLPWWRRMSGVEAGIVSYQRASWIVQEVLLTAFFDFEVHRSWHHLPQELGLRDDHIWNYNNFKFENHVIPHCHSNGFHAGLARHPCYWSQIPHLWITVEEAWKQLPEILCQWPDIHLEWNQAWNMADSDARRQRRLTRQRDDDDGRCPGLFFDMVESQMICHECSEDHNNIYDNLLRPTTGRHLLWSEERFRE